MKTKRIRTLRNISETFFLMIGQMIESYENEDKFFVHWKNAEEVYSSLKKNKEHGIDFNRPLCYELTFEEIDVINLMTQGKINNFRSVEMDFFYQEYQQKPDLKLIQNKENKND